MYSWPHDASIYISKSFGNDYLVFLNVVRGNCNEGKVRLVNGTLDREGRLEVCVNGLWGSVCPYSFSKSAAHVACKQAGYADTMGKSITTSSCIHSLIGAIVYTNSIFGSGNGPFVYANMECYGYETYLSDCSKTIFPNFTCYAQDGVGLLCRDSKLVYSSLTRDDVFIAIY